jgi:hypothetical protein
MINPLAGFRIATRVAVDVRGRTPFTELFTSNMALAFGREPSVLIATLWEEAE